VKLPIRNYTDKPLGLFIEPMYDEYEIPPGGEAIVALEDGNPDSIDVHADAVTIWNEGPEPVSVVVRPTRVSVGGR
jgi:hypothetical protein